jgi:hypothetical protein
VVICCGCEIHFLFLKSANRSFPGFPVCSTVDLGDRSDRN